MNKPARPDSRHKLIARRAGHAMVAVGIALGASLASMSTASAAEVGQQSCNVVTDRYVECIQISTYGVRDFKVHLGIDVSMSRQDAQNILDHQGEEFSARLYGDDGWWSDDDDLGAVPVTWSAAGDGGLSAELDSVAPRGRLDEDRDEDEVYAIISLYVPSSGITRTFRSDTVHGDF